MSKVIKVDDKVYEDLDKLRAKGETFGEIIAMLISARLRVLGLWSILEGQLKYREWQAQELKELQDKAAEKTSAQEEVKL